MGQRDKWSKLTWDIVASMSWIFSSSEWKGSWNDSWFIWRTCPIQSLLPERSQRGKVCNVKSALSSVLMSRAELKSCEDTAYDNWWREAIFSVVWSFYLAVEIRVICKKGKNNRRKVSSLRRREQRWLLRSCLSFMFSVDVWGSYCLDHGT